MNNINHEKWSKMSYTLAYLHPDLDNPRLHTKPANDKEAYHMLVKYQDVYSLAKEIVALGYAPVEDIIVVSEGGKKRVVEGNRRLTSYKLLKDPSLAPEEYRKKFERLSSSYKGSLPSKIFVATAPNRAEANIYVYRKHTPTAFSKKWDKIQQAVFIRRLINQYDSPQEALDMQTIVSRSEAFTALMTLALYELIPSLDLSAEKKKLLSNPSNFPYSVVIERLLIKPIAEETLGIRASLENGIEFKVTKEVGLKILSKIMCDATEPDEKGTRKMIDTRSLNSHKDQEKYIKSLNPPGERQEEWQSLDIEEKPEEVEPEEKPSKPSPPAKPSTKRYGNQLFPEKMTYEGKHCDRLEGLLLELQTNKPLGSHVNSQALLLRTTLELSMIAWLKKSNHWNEANQAAKNKKIGPMLSEMINILSNYYKTELNLSTQEANAVKTFLNDHSVDTLNAIVHNPHFPADEQSLKILAEKSYPLLKALLA